MIQVIKKIFWTQIKAYLYKSKLLCKAVWFWSSQVLSLFVFRKMFQQPVCGATFLFSFKNDLLAAVFEMVPAWAWSQSLITGWWFITSFKASVYDIISITVYNSTPNISIFIRGYIFIRAYRDYKWRCFSTVGGCSYSSCPSWKITMNSTPLVRCYH